MSNPYMQGKGKTPKEPMIFRVPIHNFKGAKDMEDSLYPFEACMARIPNITQEGFVDHVAFVFKDGDGKVYSTAMAQHHGVLKDTEENKNAFQVKSTKSVPSDKQASSGQEVGSGFSEQSQESTQQGSQETTNKENSSKEKEIRWSAKKK